MSEKILLVDDDPVILSSYQRSLRQFSISTASSGQNALDKIGAGDPYAVVLSDLRMPGMDGTALLQRVREKAPDIVRIILTGNADLRTAIEAVNSGNIFKFLEKPCPIEYMVKILQAALIEHKKVASENRILNRTPLQAIERGPLGRVKFTSGDDVIVLADGLRQGEHGTILEVLPALDEHDPHRVCVIVFQSVFGKPTGRYFTRELIKA